MRVELSQSRREQQEYLKNVELARVLDKRAERKRKAGGGDTVEERPAAKQKEEGSNAGVEPKQQRKRRKKEDLAPIPSDAKLESVLGSIF